MKDKILKQMMKEAEGSCPDGTIQALSDALLDASSADRIELLTHWADLIRQMRHTNAISRAKLEEAQQTVMVEHMVDDREAAALGSIHLEQTHQRHREQLGRALMEGTQPDHWYGFRLRRYIDRD